MMSDPVDAARASAASSRRSRSSSRIALIGVGAGFLFLVWGASFAGPDFKVAHLVARRALLHPLGRRALHLAGRPQHDHQAVDRAHRRPDDGRLVPVDLGRAICRRRRRAGRERRDGRRPGDQPARSASTPTPARSRRSAWIAIGVGVVLLAALAGRSRSGCTVSNKTRAVLALAAAALALAGCAELRRLSRSSAPPVRINEDPYPSTYRPLSRRADGHPPRDRLRRRGRPDRTTARSSSPTASRRRSAGRSSPSPAGAPVIDGTGKWVTPGIIDIHSHLGDYPSPGVEAQFRRQRGDRAGPPRSLGRT